MLVSLLRLLSFGGICCLLEFIFDGLLLLVLFLFLKEWTLIIAIINFLGFASLLHCVVFFNVEGLSLFLPSLK